MIPDRLDLLERPGGPLVLLAGDSRDLPAVRRTLRALPEDAWGRVLIEVAVGVQIHPLALPAGVSLTWLRRDRGLGMARRGELLATAVEAWLAEWQPEEESREGDLIWIGCATSPRVSALYRGLAERLAPSVLAEPHR